MDNQYYLYHKLIQYAIEHKDNVIKPYHDVFQKDENGSLNPLNVKPIIDKLEEDKLIETHEGYGSEYKRIKIKNDKIDFLKEGGYLNSKELKIHEILRFLSEETEKNPRKHSFVSDEIKQELFLKQLRLPTSLGEINYLLKTLIEDDIVIDCSAKADIGAVCILVKNETSSAYYGKKYLNSTDRLITQTFHVENFQSNSGVIHGNQSLGVNESPVAQKKKSKNIIGVIGLILTVISIIVAVMIAKGMI